MNELCLGKQWQRMKELLQDGDLDVNNSDGLQKTPMDHLLACKQFPEMANIIEMLIAAGVPLFPTKRNRTMNYRGLSLSPLQRIGLIFDSPFDNNFAKFEASLVHTTVATSSPLQWHLNGLKSLYSKLCLIRAGLEIQNRRIPMLLTSIVKSLSTLGCKRAMNVVLAVSPLYYTYPFLHIYMDYSLRCKISHEAYFKGIIKWHMRIFPTLETLCICHIRNHMSSRHRGVSILPKLVTLSNLLPSRFIDNLCLNEEFQGGYTAENFDETYTYISVLLEQDST